MPQIQLPLFPEGVAHITLELAFIKQDGKVTYFNGSMPIFSHDEKDYKTFRMITSQFYVNGQITQADIIRVFGVSQASVKRWVKVYRERGVAGFYEPRRTRGAVVLTDEVLAQAQQLIFSGKSVSEIANELKIKANTLSKALHAGRLKKKRMKTYRVEEARSF